MKGLWEHQERCLKVKGESPHGQGAVRAGKVVVKEDAVSGRYCLPVQNHVFKVVHHLVSHQNISEAFKAPAPGRGYVKRRWHHIRVGYPGWLEIESIPFLLVYIIANGFTVDKKYG